jgi:hypothetical protein
MAAKLIRQKHDILPPIYTADRVIGSAIYRIYRSCGDRFDANIFPTASDDKAA